MVSILASFGLATILATFKKLGNFCSISSGHPDPVGGFNQKWINCPSRFDKKPGYVEANIGKIFQMTKCL